MYEFYRNIYKGDGLEEPEFSRCITRAQEQLDRYKASFRVTGTQEAEMRALCAMAEAIAYFDAAQNGQGGLRYASVGTVSVSGKGIYSQVDISPAARERELYRCAGQYLQIYRGV